MHEHSTCETTRQANTMREKIAPVLGRTPSGVFILTAADAADRETGMLVSWVQQAAFDPPMISVAVNKQRFLHDWFAQVPRMALSLVGESQKQLLKHFVRGFEPDEPAFEGLEITRGVTGLPVLTAALGYLEGPIVGRMETGDHIVYLMEVVGAGDGEALKSKQPMVHIRKNGFTY